MYHSITFGEKNTWDDWHLIPSSRPIFSPPQPNFKMLQIPGKSGSLDMSELLDGQVVYADRSGSIEFHLDYEPHNGQKCPWEDWMDAYETISNYLHGQKMKAVLEDDTGYYYEGRFSVNSFRSNANWSTITIDYVVQPFKMAVEEYGSDWLWDTFSFEDPEDYIDSLIGLEAIDGGTDVELIGFGYRTIPTIHCYSPGILMYFDNYDTPIELSVGDNRPSIAVITQGRHVLSFYGTGQIFDIHYRSGSL